MARRNQLSSGRGRRVRCFNRIMSRGIDHYSGGEGRIAMRINRIFSLAVIAFLMSAVACYAEEFRGRITKVDTAQKEIVVERRRSARRGCLVLALEQDTP